VFHRSRGFLTAKAERKEGQSGVSNREFRGTAYKWDSSAPKEMQRQHIWWWLIHTPFYCSTNPKYRVFVFLIAANQIGA
jgi:hypothetical protein